MTASQKLTVPQAIAYAVAQGLIPVIGYIRVSTWREEKISPEIQQSVIAEAAARKGRHVVAWIHDLDVSGRHFKRRIMEAIEIVEAGGVYAPVREIWVWKFSRFGRSRYGVAINLTRVERVGGHLVSATEDVDATTATGRFARGMLFEVAAFESDRAGEQWKETHELRRRRGLPSSGGRRFGYLWHPRRVPDPSAFGGWTLQDEWYEVIDLAAEAVLKGYQRYNGGGVGFGEVTADWIAQGHLNAYGRRWQDQSVRNFMDSGFAAGLLRVHNPEADCGAPQECDKNDHHIYIPAEHEAIIDGDEWDAYRETRDARRPMAPRARRATYPLTGLVRCGICGGGTRAAPGNGRLGYAYRCGKLDSHAVDHETVWRRRDEVEADVLRWLENARGEIDALTVGDVVEAAEVASRDEAVHAEVRRELAQVLEEMDHATDSFTKKIIPEDAYLRQRDRLVARQRAIEKRLADAASETPRVVQLATHRETVAGLLEDWETIPVVSLNAVLRTLVRRVEVTRKATRVVPVWAPPDSEPA